MRAHGAGPRRAVGGEGKRASSCEHGHLGRGVGGRPGRVRLRAGRRHPFPGAEGISPGQRAAGVRRLHGRRRSRAARSQGWRPALDVARRLDGWGRRSDAVRHAQAARARQDRRVGRGAPRPRRRRAREREPLARTDRPACTRRERAREGAEGDEDEGRAAQCLRLHERGNPAQPPRRRAHRSRRRHLVRQDHRRRRRGDRRARRLHAAAREPPLRMNRALLQIRDALTSLKLAIGCLALLMILVAAQVRRLELSWRKAGIWIVHAGLILLFVGEFVTGGFQVDGRLAFEVGQTTNFVEVPHETELAVIDQTDPGFDDVYGVSERALARGGTVALPGTPLSLQVKSYQRNAQLAPAAPGEQDAGVTNGAGAGLALHPLPPVTGDDQADLSVAVVAVLAGGRSVGTWLASNAIEQAQQFTAGDRTYALFLRSRREYLPYSLTLEKFRHDIYAGTDIPKNFSSLVRLENPPKGENRDVLIYMNQPLRYDGKAFYQASFGKNDTLSILQVVQNPGWLLPYISCVLVTSGLLLHFAISLRRSVKRRQATAVEA